MQGLPTGTVTFLFTDLAGSTRLWEDFPDAMHAALARHDELAAVGAYELAARCEAVAVERGWVSMGDAALDHHQAALAPLRTALGADAAAAAAAWARSAQPEDLAAAVLAELDALIATAPSVGTGEEEQPAPRP